MNRLKTILTTSACAISITTAAYAGNFDIPAGDLRTALSLYVQQSGALLAVSDDAVKGIRTKGVRGDLSSDEALTRILTGTGFIARDHAGALAIVRHRQSDLVQPLHLAQASPNTGRIEEVLVTARKREEAVENIPISITALSSEDLKTFGIRNFADLEGVVPGLSMGGGGNGVKKDSNPFIRGIGQRETKVTLDPGVATYIDGIYIGRAAGAMLDVVDVDNIQVLRGPQGTLFGRNATGGALSVTLKKPTNDWEAQISANIGNYGRRDISGIVNIPFVEDMVMGRLLVASTNSNGYFTNIIDNTKWGGDNRVSGIAQLRILPTDNITIDLLAERTRIRETPRPQKCAFVRQAGYTTPQTNFLIGFVDGISRFEARCRASEALPASQFSSDAALGGTPLGRTEMASYFRNDPEQLLYQPLMPRGRYWVDTTTFGGTASWDIGDVGPFSDLSAKSITAWRSTKQIADEDLDGIGSAFLIRLQPTFDETTQFSQEFQISGKTLNDRLFLSTGAYYFKEKTPQNDLILSAGGAQTFAGTTSNPYYYNTFFEPAFERLQTDNDAWAWYGQADFELTPEIELTAGIRWTTENRWSRYSKSFVDINSLTNAPITLISVNNQASGQTGFRTSAPSLTPVLDWRFGGFTYDIGLNGNNEVVVTTFVPGLMAGDELSYKNSAWTPMFSAKYKASDRWLQKFSLDQAMIYATYSQGFHSGGVTAGSLDYDQGPETIRLPSGPPCSSCTVVTQLPIPGEGFGTADPITFEPEKVTNYEVGFKAAGLDRRIQATFAAFYMDYTDMQVTSAGSRAGIPVPFIENVGSSVIKGFEVELVALPTPQWRILMNGSYTDTDIKEWQSSVAGIGNTNGIPTGLIYEIDRSDERMPRVPRWQFFASSEYNFQLPGGGTITPSVGVRFASSIYHGFDRGSWIYTYGGRYYNHGGDRPPSLAPSSASCTSATPSASCDWNGGSNNPPADPIVTPSADAKWKTTSRPTAFLDARLAWISDDGKMEGALWGKNLFNKDDYLVGGIPLVDVNGAVGQVYANPRTFGLTFTYHFGE